MKFTLSVDKDPKDYLQIQISRDRDNKQLKLYQTGYVTKLAENYKIGEGDGLRIPFTTTNDLTPIKEMKKDEIQPYMELVGSMLWALKTRSDCSIYLSILGRYMNCYDKQVFQKAHRLLRYLYFTKDYGIVYDEPFV